MRKDNDETANPGEDSLQKALEIDLAAQLRFQRRWRLISMSAYVSTSIGMLLCSASATYLAARGEANKAAILSAVATVLVGTEKSLLFREKWKFHLLMYTKLNLLRAKMLLGQLELNDAANEYASIMSSYAAELPMEARE